MHRFELGVPIRTWIFIPSCDEKKKGKKLFFFLNEHTNKVTEQTVYLRWKSSNGKSIFKRK